MALSHQQKLFAHEWLVDRNATQAAKRSGYSPRTAGSQGHDLLKHPEIKQLIEEGIGRLQENADLTVERVVLELRRILQVDPLLALEDDGSVKPLSEWPEDLRRALSSIEVEEEMRFEEGVPVTVKITKLRWWSKTSAAKSLLHKLGAFSDPTSATLAKSLAQLIEAGLARKSKK